MFNMYHSKHLGHWSHQQPFVLQLHLLPSFCNIQEKNNCFPFKNEAPIHEVTFYQGSLDFNTNMQAYLFLILFL